MVRETKGLREYRRGSKSYIRLHKIKIGINEAIEEILKKNPLSFEDKNRLVDLIAKKRDVEDKLRELTTEKMFLGVFAEERIIH